MYLFLVPLLVGFFFNSASAFTSFYSHHLGERGGKLVSIILRDVLGIPIWVIGYVLAAWTTSSNLLNPSLFSSTLAWILIIAGGVVICVGLWSLRWRAAAPSIQDTLVSDGLYAHIRHPLYTGMILELCGLFLSMPRITIGIACLSGILWTLIQARLEELDLLKRLPAYKEYMERVPPFLPRLK